MKAYLKIKIMSLAAEAAIIRREAGKWPRERDFAPDQRTDPKNRERWTTRLGLNQHRRFDVREEARAALLAYGYLRGRRYRRIEFKCWDMPDPYRVRDLVVKYGPEKNKAVVENALRAWLAEPLSDAKAA
jgi:hypothetical protein